PRILRASSDSSRIVSLLHYRTWQSYGPCGAGPAIEFTQKLTPHCTVPSEVATIHFCEYVVPAGRMVSVAKGKRNQRPAVSSVMSALPLASGVVGSGLQASANHTPNSTCTARLSTVVSTISDTLL